jgi:hypothetical protein
MSSDDENHFEYALGFAVVRRWGIFQGRLRSFFSTRPRRVTTACERGLHRS